MRYVVVAVLGMIWPGAALAQPVVSLSSKAESGWTSNASESVGGAPDFYLRHSHDLSVTTLTGPLALRGSLQVEQQVFRLHQGENDLSLAGGVEAGLALTDGLSLRLGYAQTREWNGDMVDLGPLVVSLETPVVEHEILGEIAVEDAGRRVVLGVDVSRRQPGPTTFAGLPLPPLRLEAEMLQVRARADGEWVVTPEMAGLTRLHWTTTRISEDDRTAFGREPAGLAELAAGLRLRQGALATEAWIGVDLVWPEAAPHLLHRLPFFEASAELAASDRLMLEARGFAGVELADPVDGVASRVLEAELGGRLALAERASLTMGLAWRREQGLYDESSTSTRRSLRAGITMPLAAGLEAGLTASHAEIAEPGGAYRVSTIGLTLNGKV
ncbi:MAG: hypothetical protein ABS76_20590 [Pelagibacterium sp. SCN 64-44]|nr:MAG: hypothetical protein ABS76_20590 [Pelagibacterium sp. SCN 64-44]